MKENNKENVKMYCFDPNHYSEVYYVLAENKIKAHDYLIRYLEKKAAVSPTYKKDLNKWINVNPLIEKSFPEDYSIKEYEIGEVAIEER